MYVEEDLKHQEVPEEVLEKQEFDSPVRLCVKFSMDGDRRYVAGELEGEFEGMEKALGLYDDVRERYKDEVGLSPLEVFFGSLSLEKVVALLTEETAAAMPFPLPKIKDKSYVGKTVGEVFVTEDGLVDWVQRKIKYDEEGDISKKLGIAACVWYFTDKEREF